MLLELFLFYHSLILFLGTYKDIWKYRISKRDYVRRFGTPGVPVTILLHAVSCGEAMSLKPFIDLFEKQKRTFQMTVHTPTGYNLIKGYTAKCRLKPYDTFFTMFYLFFTLRPKIVIVAESDLWPMFTLMVKLFRCKLYLVNYTVKAGRLRNAWHLFLADKIYTKEMTKGSPKYHYLGNIKLLQTPDSLSMRKPDAHPTIIIASAGRDECDLHLDYIRAISSWQPKVKFIYVPRHLHWEEEFKAKLESNPIKNLTVYWSIGVLNDLYAESHICLMGDTFNSVGGHNLVEPAAKKNVLLLGPNYHTCKDVANIFKKGLFVCLNREELILVTKKILTDRSYLDLGEVNLVKFHHTREEIRVNFQNAFSI
jgi:3-deoxy-D-manno-octulosonic-acid transferase